MTKPRKSKLVAPRKAKPSRIEEPVPLDLLCNMAWLLLSKDNGDGDGGEEMAWRRCCHKADTMIREAREAQRWEIAFREIEQEDGDRVSEREEVIFQLLTPQEQDERWVSFERGCQIITGLKKKQDAVKKFAAINAQTDISEQTTRQLRLKGFRLRLVAECQEIYESMPTEIRKKFRKPYEKSGEHTKEAKEGRKKIQKK
jgi:hypothetical protein